MRKLFIAGVLAVMASIGGASTASASPCYLAYCHPCYSAHCTTK